MVGALAVMSCSDDDAPDDAADVTAEADAAATTAAITDTTAAPAATDTTAASTATSAATATTGAPDTTEAAATTEAPATTAAAGPAPGGTLVVAISSDPGGLNPAITTSGGTHTASELMFNGLVELDADGQPQPELAESWEITDDGATYTFTLRDGVTWHDGEPFTSADVVYTFNEVLTTLHSRTAASVGSNIMAIEAPDEATVVFRFNQPYAPLLQQLDVTEAPILPAHLFEGTDPMENPANNAPVGTGPFRFVSYTPDAEIRMERNADYFKDGLPLLDEVVMRVIPDAGTRVAALENGEVDWLFDVPGPDLERLGDDENYGTLETLINPGGSNCIMTVTFNLERPIFADQRVRQSIASALDRDQFLERVLFGQGLVAEAPISSGIGFAHAEDVELPAFDRDAAAALLDEAGWVREGDGVRTAQGVEGVADGTPLAFNFVHFPTFAAYGELYRAQLAEVGIEVTLQPLEPPVFATTVFTDRNFDTNIISYCNGQDPEIGVRRMYDSARIGPVPFSNAAAYSNPDVDALFAEAAATIDTETRTDLYRQIQEQVAADLPYVWIVETASTRLFTANCQDFLPSGHFAETASCG